MGTKVFWSEPSGAARESLRRYASDSKCPGYLSYHDAEVHLGDIEMQVDAQLNGRSDDFDHKDPRWPKKCDHCAYVFQPEDQWQHNVVRYYEGGGKRFVLREAPVGAMWDATWFPEDWPHGEDGICLVVRTPGGDWMVDSRASNCTLPNDNQHKCWVRHGDPRTGSIHVDKNGQTCSAGAGSIQAGSYHGFLHNGVLT